MNNLLQDLADLRHWRDAGAEHGHVDGHSWAQETTEIKARVKELECEKADMVLRNKLLRDRPDLPAERLAAYVELLEGRDKLRDQLVAMTEQARQLEFDNRYLTMSNEVLASNCAAMTEDRDSLKGQCNLAWTMANSGKQQLASAQAEVARLQRALGTARACHIDDNTMEHASEAAYWSFDARRKGYAEFQAPQSERDAFKQEARSLIRHTFPTTEYERFKRKHPIRMWWEQMLLAVGESYARTIGSRHE